MSFKWSLDYWCITFSLRRAIQLFGYSGVKQIATEAASRLEMQERIKFLTTLYSSPPQFFKNLNFLPWNFRPLPLFPTLNSLNIIRKITLLPLSLFSTLYSSPQPWYFLPLFTTWYSFPTDFINSPPPREGIRNFIQPPPVEMSSLKSSKANRFFKSFLEKSSNSCCAREGLTEHFKLTIYFNTKVSSSGLF